MALTKVTGHVIKSDTNIISHNINSSGIITAVTFDGNVSGVAVTFTGDSTIGSLGITTNLTVGGNIDVDGQTNLDHVSIAGVTTVTGEIKIPDLSGSSNKISLGTNQNLQIYYDSSSYITNGTAGHLFLKTLNGGSDIRLESNDDIFLMTAAGSRNSIICRDYAQVELYYNNTKRLETTNTGAIVSGILTVTGNMNVEGVLTYQDVTNIDSIGIVTARQNIHVGDSIIHHGDTDTKIRFPTDNQIQIDTAGQQRVKILDSGFVGIGTGIPSTLLDVNSGSAATIQIKNTDTVNYMTLYIGASANSIYSRGANSSTPRNFTIHQGNAEVLKIDTAGNLVLKDTVAQGNSLVNYIQANDVNGAAQYILGQVSTGNQDLYLQQSKNANLRFQTNSSTRWKIDGNPGHLLPEVAGAVDIGSTSAEIGNVYIADDKRFYAGSDQNISLYHNSSTNINHLVGHPGNMFYQSATHYFTDAAQSKIQAQFIHNNYCELRHAGNLKFRTSETGIDVTGEVKATQDYPNIQPTLDLNFAAVKKLDPRITFYRTTTGSYIDENGDYRWASENEPRFDHDEVTHESKGLLMEVARTNKLSSGNNIDYNTNSGGSPGPSLVANNVEAPDGSFTARTIDYTNALASNANSANSEYSWGDSAPAGKTYSASVWVKGIQGQTINMYLDASGQGSGNLNEAKITRTLTGKWQRMSVYYTYPVGANAAVLRIGPRNLHGLGQGTSTVVSMWGVTVVEESRPGSTIATPIVATTTAADYALIDGEEFSEFYSPLEHTTVMIGKRAANVAGSDGRLYTISDGSSSQVAPDWDLNDGTSLRLSTNVGGSSQMVQQISSWSGINDEFKIAAGIALNNQIGVVNGTAIAAADTSCAIPTGVDRLYFGLRGDGGNQGSLTIKRFIFYPKRLPDSQLVTLTS